MKITIIKAAVSLTLTPLFLSSCEKELDFRYHDIEPLTVIEGEITPVGTRVGITFTTPMDEPMDRTRLTDATVTVTDLTAGETCVLEPDSEGYYSGGHPGVEGHLYRLVVERDGRRYEAEATLYPAVEIEGLEFNWIQMPYDHVAVFQARFRECGDGGSGYYWVKLYRNGEIYLWSEKDSRGISGGSNTFMTMTTRMDTEEEDAATVLYDGDVIECTVLPVSRSMHDYLEALQNDSNGPAMFSGDKCLGYFIATSPASASIVFHPDEIPEYAGS